MATVGTALRSKSTRRINGKNKTPNASNTLAVHAATGADKEAILAQTVLRPSLQASNTIRHWNGNANDLEIAALMAELCTQSKLVSSGDFARTEAMLVNQAHTLDAIFNNLARRSALNAGEYLGACETYMRLALKAQSQCRATLETLAEIKNPRPVAFVQQANISNGPQQVNNAAQSQDASRAGESESQPNGLLRQQTDECLDPRTSSTAVRANSQMEAVESLNGTEDPGRQGASGTKRL